MTMEDRPLAKVVLLAMLVLNVGGALCQSSNDALLRGFRVPPAEARPQVWWHWVSGNISREGIKQDLEWMNHSGIGGFQLIDLSFFTRTVVPARVTYMSPEWWADFQYATALAAKLKLQTGISTSPGWSETGGPWVEPSQGMKKYVWSELPVVGDAPFSGTLPHPPSNTGAFQNLPIDDAGALLSAAYSAPTYYADSSVVAFKIPPAELTAEAANPTMTSSVPLDLSGLDGSDPNISISVPLGNDIGSKEWIQYDYRQPVTIRSMVIILGKTNLQNMFMANGAPSGVSLEASDDNEHYRVIVGVPLGGATQHTLSFSPVKARYFRVTFEKLAQPAAGTAISAGAPPAQPMKKITLKKLLLLGGSRVNRFEEKAGFRPIDDLSLFSTPATLDSEIISKENVIDLTRLMRADGHLDWTPPPGEWMIVRFGYSLLGITNHPAGTEATGLEVDKLSATAVGRYMDQYLGKFKSQFAHSNSHDGRIETLLSDSWEAGAQNWTDNMLDEFAKRRGYSAIPWLPVLAGRIVQSSEDSDKFLWDFRKTISDLVAEAHFGQVAAAARVRRLQYFAESQEDGRAFIGDGMEAKKLASVPMGAMWLLNPEEKRALNYDADDRESASVAHIYGQNLAAAESLTYCGSTAAWSWSPSDLKPIIDREFLNGINKIFIHDSAHQPLIGKVPGVSLGMCGVWFNRNTTWADEASVWVDYIARSSWMLQQGRSLADIAYFYGEDSNLTAIFHETSPTIPPGYDFDYVNADALINQLQMVNGRITARGGVSYRVLVLDKHSSLMSLPVLRKIRDLVLQGATVVGDRPTDTPSLSDDKKEFATIRDQLFPIGRNAANFGRGHVFPGHDIKAALRSTETPEDFTYTGISDANQVRFVHRHLDDGEVYFLNNRGDQAVEIHGNFRVTGRAAQFWIPESGKTLDVSYTSARGFTAVPIRLEPWGSVFVVFRGKASSRGRIVPSQVYAPLASVEGPWHVAFQANRGAPAEVDFKQLISWPDSDDKGIKYFSGDAIYSKEIDMPASWLSKPGQLWLNLGDVRDLAVVTVNGKRLGTLWHAPYRINIGTAIKAGKNRIEVKVVNEWANRLIGDQQADEAVKYTFTTWKSYGPSSALRPSGLLGPVAIEKLEVR